MAKKKNKIKKTQRATKPKAKSKSRQYIRSGIRILLAIMIPLIIYNLPSYNMWIKSRAIPYFKDMKRQWNSMDIESRRLERHGVTYQIANYVCENVPEDSWFLMPPQAFYLDRIYASNNQKIQEIYRYISHVNIFAFHCTKLNLLNMDMSKEILSKAEYTLDVRSDGSMSIVKITSAAQLNEIVKRFTYEFGLATDHGAVVNVVNELKKKK